MLNPDYLGFLEQYINNLQEDKQEEALYTKTGTIIPIKRKNFSKDLKRLGKKAEIEFTVTPRGCRAGFVCQAFMHSLYHFGEIRDEVINHVKKQAFWKDEAYKPYERFCLDQIMDTTNS